MEPTAILQRLLASDVFADDFPVRGTEGAAGEAIQRVPMFAETVEDIRALGKAKFEQAVPALTHLWNVCALVPARQAAGFALRDIGTPAAQASLVALIEGTDPFSLRLAICAIFDAGPETAFDRCAPRFDEEEWNSDAGVQIANRILHTFCPTGFRYKDGAEIPQWREPQAPAWFAADPRWLELCVARRNDPWLGPTARRVLRYADKKQVDAALDEALRSSPRAALALATSAPGNLLERYKAGEHVAVWRELGIPDAVAGALRDEARSVAEETMARVRRNADKLAERLAARGWVALGGSLRTLPTQEDVTVMSEVERRTSAELPTSLRVFWEVVGGIDFIWDYEQAAEPPSLGVDLPMVEMDPLTIWPARDARYLFDEWDHSRAGIHPELADPYVLNLAPDFYHKADISGGAPYGVELPFLGTDAMFLNEANDLPFVSYLRLCFRWGGFPMLQHHAEREDVKVFVAEMTEGLETF